MAEQFNDIGRKLLSPLYDPKSDRQPTADEVVDAEERDVKALSAAVKVQPKNTELAALELSVQKSARQGTADMRLPV